MGNEFLLLSGDAQVALTEFSEDFAAALTQSGVEQWAKENGVYRQSKALLTTWPIPVSAAGYQELKGDIKYRQLASKRLQLTPKTWQDGVEELASVIEAPDFIGWTSEPAAMATAADSVLNEVIAALLEANGTIELDGKAFFAGDHPYNVFKPSTGSFANDITGAGTDPTAANLKLAMQHFRDVKAPNGKPMGLRMTHVLAPAAQEGAWRDILESDTLIQVVGDAFGAVSNRVKNSVKLVISDELTDDNKWYPLALNKPGMRPWVVQDQGAPEEIRNDKDSDHYKRTLKVGVAYIVRANGALSLPHCIQRWAGTAPE